MSAPIRVQLRRAKGWKMPPNTVRVDRATPWGNPFVVGKHGTRKECVEMHRMLMSGLHCLTSGNDEAQEAHANHVRDHIRELTGKNLACWCPLDAPCHADTLLEAAEYAACNLT